MRLLADCGEQITPFADGPVVQALKLDLVRAEFIKTWPALGAKNPGEAKTLAFRRAIKDAIKRKVVATRELNGADFIWLARAAEAKSAPSSAGKTNGGSEPAGSGIPFTITVTMKDELKRRGFSDHAIFDMTPQHAREVLADPNRNADTERFKVVGEVMEGAACVQCGETGGVQMLRDSRAPGSKPVALHMRHAAEWFDNQEAPFE